MHVANDLERLDWRLCAKTKNYGNPANVSGIFTCFLLFAWLIVVLPSARAPSVTSVPCFTSYLQAVTKISRFSETSVSNVHLNVTFVSH